MSEQIPIASNNYQDDNQQNLVIENQQNPENIQNTENPQNPENPEAQKLPQNLVSSLICFGLIYTFEILWNIFAWFVTCLSSIFSFDYKTNKRDVDDKYYSGVKTFILPLLALSYIIICVISNRKINPKINVIIDIILLGIKIPIFILYINNLFEICHSQDYIPIISIVLECSLVMFIFIYEWLKYEYLFKNK